MLHDLFPMVRNRRLRGGCAPGQMCASLLMLVFVATTAWGCRGEVADEAETAAAVVPGGSAEAGGRRQAELLTELRALDESLTPIRSLALQDPDIQAQEQALMVEVDAAMERLSPGFLEARDRFEVLRAEYSVAQEAGDQERLQTLGTELQALQMQIQGAQNAAAGEESVTEAIESFRQTLFVWMRAEDPEIGSLLDRVVEITDELQSMGPPEGL